MQVTLPSSHLRSTEIYLNNQMPTSFFYRNKSTCSLSLAFSRHQDSLEFGEHRSVMWLPLVSGDGQRIQVAAVQVRPVTGGHLARVAKATVMGTLWSEVISDHRRLTYCPRYVNT